MARTAKSANNIQVFRGSLPRPDVFAKNNGSGCCGVDGGPTVDRLGQRTRFDNGLAHSNPTGAGDKFTVPSGNGFSGVSREIIDHINAVGVGASISVLALPTYGYLTGVGIHIAAAELGLTFTLSTRNGTVLPTTTVQVVEADPGPDACDIVRTLAAGNAASFVGFGALGNNLFVDILGRNGNGSFILEAEELILTVVTMPASGVITGAFDITVSATYDVTHRAER
jgi:hypothetical protein